MTPVPEPIEGHSPVAFTETDLGWQVECECSLVMHRATQAKAREAHHMHLQVIGLRRSLQGGH